MLLWSLDHLGVIAQSVLGLEGPDAIEVVGGEGEVKEQGGLDQAITRKKPRLRSAKAPLRAELADSTTWRRAMLVRHAVVPNVMLCHHDSSTGIAARDP